MRKINIAIVGLGNIGSYLYKYLRKNKQILAKKNNCIPNIIYLSAKNKNRNRGFKINNKQWVKNYLDVIKKKRGRSNNRTYWWFRRSCKEISL